MSQRPLPILHVDGSLSEYVDQKGILHKVAGLGGYLVLEGKIVDKFFKSMKNAPHLNHHEEYAIIEGLKWVKSKNFNTVKIKTDSLPSVHLFNHQKKNITKEDKFFLLQFMMLEYAFEWVEIQYHSRSDDDLSHQLSRNYMKEIPEGVLRLHHENNRKKAQYEIIQDAAIHTPTKLQKILCDSMKEINTLISTR